MYFPSDKKKKNKHIIHSSMLNLLYAIRGALPPSMDGGSCSMDRDPIHGFYSHVAFSIIKTL